MEREVRYCTTEDGVRIAYSVEGDGPVLVMCPFFVESFSLDHLLPERTKFMEKLGEGRRVVRYDSRGTGLSARDLARLGPDDPLLDLASVAQAIGGPPFALWASGPGGPTAIRFAAMSPERVGVPPPLWYVGPHP